MAPASVLRARKIVRSLTLESTRESAAKVLTMGSGREVESFLKSRV